MNLLGIVRQLDDGPVIDTPHLHHDLQRRTAPEVVREMGSDSEADRDAMGEIVMDLHGAVHVETVAEDKSPGAGVDSEGLIVLDHPVTEQERVAAIVTNPIKGPGQRLIEVIQKGIQTERVRQGNPQTPLIGLDPAPQGFSICVPNPGQARDTHDPLMGHGSDGREIEDSCKMHIGGAGQARPTLRLPDEDLLTPVISTPTGPEISIQATGLTQRRGFPLILR